jgi:hypothetical protein
MKKILSISQDQIISGISTGKFNQKTGAWYFAEGMNPHVSDDDLNSLITSSEAPTDISASVLTDTPMAMTSIATSPNSGSLYILGDGGHLYTVDLTGNNNPVDKRSATPITTAANGIEVFKEGQETQFSVDANTVALWHMDGTDGTAGKQDNAEGTAGYDLTEGAGNPTSTTGRIPVTADGAYAFTETASKYLSAGDMSGMPTGAFTVEFYIYPGTGSGGAHGLITKENFAGQRSFIIEYDDSVYPQITFKVSADGTNWVSTSTGTFGNWLVASQWYKVACVFDPSTSMKIYVNNTLNAQLLVGVPASCFNSTAEVRFGGYHSTSASANTYFTGTIDEVRLSNKARTESEIANTNANALFYWQRTQIGKWNMSDTYPTGWTDALFTGLEDTPHHPTLKLFDRLYYGNKDKIGFIYDNAGTTTNDTGALDLPAGSLVKCLTSDGQNLVIGATKNQGSDSIYSETKIYFWDTNQDSWQKEYLVPAGTINAFGRIGTTLFAFCGRKMFAFNYDTPPTLIRTLGDISMPTYEYSNTVDNIGEAVIFGGTSALTTYGKISPEAKNAFLLPYTGTTGTISAIFTDAKNDTMFIGTATPKLYRFATSNAGAQSKNWDTIYFDLGSLYRMQQIVLTMPNGIGATDSITVYANEGATTIGTIDQATYGNVKRVKLAINPAIESDMISLRLVYTAGTPSIKRIDLYGEAVNPQ